MTDNEIEEIRNTVDETLNFHRKDYLGSPISIRVDSQVCIAAYWLRSRPVRTGEQVIQEITSEKLTNENESKSESINSKNISERIISK